MKLVITSTHFRRPEYSRRTTEALAKQRDAKEWVYIASVDRGPDAEEIERIIRAYASSFASMDVMIREGAPSCNDNTRSALSIALRFDADFVVLVEDDVLLGHDALAYFAEQAGAHEHDPNIFTVSAWRHPDGWLPGVGRPVRWSDHHLVGTTPWFTPWGWGTWPDRLREIIETWTTGSDIGPFINGKIMGSWDEHLNHVVRGHRVEVHPMISRAVNIGREKGTHRGDVPLDYWVGQ